ncbi:MAG TPA: Flp pilus assembly protein CpaB [Candidatus Binataceae bacterium]|nr:Flp pilus assembly protein CpaB [Candidatus Binataceae bacterium]
MRRSALFLIAGVLVAIVATVTVYSTLMRARQALIAANAKTTDVVVAARDIPTGSRIDIGAVKIVRWPRDYLPPGVYTTIKPALGKIARAQLYANQPMVAAQLVDADQYTNPGGLIIPVNMRAIAIAVDAVGDIAGFVLPRSRVDILVTINQSGSAPPLAKTVLEDVEVLAIAQTTTQTQHPQLEKIVTVLVTPTQAEQLAVAAQQGVLRLALRGAGDDKIVETSGVDLRQALAAYADPPARTMPAKARPLQGSLKRRLDQVVVLRDGVRSETLNFDGDRLVARQSASSVPAPAAVPVAPARFAAAAPFPKPASGGFAGAGTGNLSEATGTAMGGP